MMSTGSLIELRTHIDVCHPSGTEERGKDLGSSSRSREELTHAQREVIRRCHFYF